MEVGHHTFTLECLEDGSIGEYSFNSKGDQFATIDRLGNIQIIDVVTGEII